MVTAYQILGLQSEASLEEIRTAYRTKARLFHPDQGGRVEDFLRIKKAYDILSDENLREKLGLIPQFEALPLRIYPALSQTTSVLFENLNALRGQLPSRKDGSSS